MVFRMGFGPTTFRLDSIRNPLDDPKNDVKKFGLKPVIRTNLMQRNFNHFYNLS